MTKLIINKQKLKNFDIRLGKIYILTYLYKFAKTIKVKNLIGICIKKNKSLNVQLKLISKKEGISFTFFLNSPNVIDIKEYE